MPGYWAKVPAPEGYDGECYAWGNYLAASLNDGYCCTWHLLRRSGDGLYREVPGRRRLTQTFALRNQNAGDIERILKWALSEIKTQRSQREEPESDIEDFPLG